MSKILPNPAFYQISLPQDPFDAVGRGGHGHRRDAHDAGKLLRERRPRLPGRLPRRRHARQGPDILFLKHDSSILRQLLSLYVVHERAKPVLRGPNTLRY